jgi:NADH-quinone oxidoreductase subunit J
VSPEDLAFLALGGIAGAIPLPAILVRELIHTILWVASFFVVLAGLYFLLQATFLGVLQLGVYAGAVTILLLFGVMVTRKRIFSREAAAGIGPGPVGLAILVGTLLIAVAAGLAASTGGAAPRGYDPSALSTTLFSDYGPWLLLLGLVMLSALGGAIYLVREGRE